MRRVDRLFRLKRGRMSSTLLLLAKNGQEYKPTYLGSLK